MPLSSIADVLDKLTPRRRQVLEQILLGASDAEIAQQMDISEPTVRKHVERICEFFAQELPGVQEGRFKRSDLIRLVVGQRPEMITPHQQLKEEAKQLYQQGMHEYMQGNFAIAERYFLAAIALKDNYCNAHYNLGIVYERLQQQDKARQHYQRAKNLEGSGRIAAICSLGRLEILSGRPQESIAPLQTCLQETVDNVLTLVSIYKNLGWALYLTEEYEQSISYLNQAIAIYNVSIPSHCLLAQVFEKIQDFKQAKFHWQQAIQISERSVDSGGDRSQLPWRWPEIDIWLVQAFQFLHTHV